MTPLTQEQISYLLEELKKEITTFTVPMTHGNYDVMYVQWSKIVKLLKEEENVVSGVDE